MSIIYCGAEDCDVVGGTVEVKTTSTYFRTGYARSAIMAQTSGLALLKPFSALTSCWLTFRAYNDCALTNILRCFGLVKSGTGGKGLWLGIGTNTSKIALSKYDGTTTTALVTDAGTSFPRVSLHRISMHLQNYGAATSADVYVDDTLTLSYTGDPTVSGVSDLDQIGMYTPSGSDAWELSEIIVADEDCRSWSVVTHYPNGAGDSNDWTGAYTDIDESTINFSDAITSGTDAQDFLCNLSDLPAGSFTVKGVKVAAKAVKGASGITKVALGIKSGGSINVDTAHSLDTAWTTEERYMSVNPVTGVPFTPTEINALQLALRSAT